jgi:hypothetical protein
MKVHTKLRKKNSTSQSFVLTSNSMVCCLREANLDLPDTVFTDDLRTNGLKTHHSRSIITTKEELIKRERKRDGGAHRTQKMHFVT